MARQGELASGVRKLWKRLTSSGAATTLSETWARMPAAEPLLQRAREYFSAEQAKDPQYPTARAVNDLRRFDLEGMQRAVAICNCGSSGSLLLASYFDGHDDVIMLPGHLSCAIYPFFDCYPDLSLRDKLLIYPFLSNDVGDHFKAFFQRDHPISGAAYIAAVDAVSEVYGDAPPEFLKSRRTFFLLVHAVYCVALGRLPASSRPLILYAQHEISETLARYLVEDFAQARFIHTVRDPITNCGRLYEHYFIARQFMAPAYVISHLTVADAPHANMYPRTLAVRFEDLHLHLEETMQAVVDWLELTYQPVLLESTFNGRPWIVSQGTNTWTGRRREQAARDTRNVSTTDRGLLFAVLYEDFAAWGYPFPEPFKYGFVRAAVCLLLLLVPLRLEIITLRRVLKTRKVRDIGRGLLQLATGRAAIMALLAAELFRRLAFGKVVLPVRYHLQQRSGMPAIESMSTADPRRRD